MKRQTAQTGGVCAVVPVNVLRASKARLARYLDDSTRSRLSAAMLVDVLDTLQKVRGITRITVVSADFGVRRITRPMRVHFLWEGKRRGLNKGVRVAMRDAKHRRFSAAVIVPSDIPLAKPREISRFLHSSDGYSVAIAPSKDGGGTNALLLRPPGVIRPVFGKNSFRKHVAEADHKGLSVRVVKSAGIALDVDEPADLISIGRFSLRNETGRFLRTMDGPSWERITKSKFNWSVPAKKVLT